MYSSPPFGTATRRVHLEPLSNLVALSSRRLSGLPGTAPEAAPTQASNPTVTATRNLLRSLSSIGIAGVFLL
ncbi:hypothetical protein EDF62_3031 [Leucobacter luti]|uniref:Uncharacterized protein n=1 Tax=Leucobacter luti TaxID=340320 RepID=A0A4R6RSL4_9MICO|nr:hypothetical protein EDF62_3031 [Leucobacter luti]